MKYTLIVFNLFGFILAIFNALFGIGYPTASWPGGYTGGQMAIFSLVVMAFTTVGYCGAHHHKSILLIPYGIAIFLIIVGNIALFIVYNEKSIVGQMSTAYMIFCGIVALVLLIFTLVIVYKLRQTDPTVHYRASTPTSVLQRAAESGQNNPQSTPTQNNRSNNYSNVQTTHPCPVPGCNYGKVVAS